MKISSLKRSLVPVVENLTFPCTDEADPRVAHLLRPLDEATASGGFVCVIVGVPQHVGVERNGGRPGAEGAPEAIRRALYRMATSAIAGAIGNGSLAVVDAGDIGTEGKTLEQIHDQQHDVVQNILHHGMFPIVIGGGHDTAWPTIQALNSIGQPYGVMNIDAHADVRPLMEGVRSHSGSPFRQMLEAPLRTLAAGSFVEFGLQHHAVSRSHIDYVVQQGMHVHMLDDIRMQGTEHAWNAAWNRVSECGNAYVSLDMDCFASAYAPGVSAPATDGFVPYELASALRYAGRQPQLRVFDVVEMNPVHDVDGRTARLAASMIMHVLAGIADRVSG